MSEGIRISDFRKLKDSDTLVLEYDGEIKQGDTLQIGGFSIEVTHRQPTSYFGRFNWLVDFTCEDLEKFREFAAIRVEK